MEGDLIKAKVRVDKQFYPKDKDIENGDFGILTVFVNEVIEGEPHEHPKFHTITIKGNLIEFNRTDEYMLLAKEAETNKYGTSYNVISFFEELDFTDRNNQIIFLRRILTENQINNLYNYTENPIDLLEKGDIDSLCNVKGIGEKVAEKLIEKYRTHKDYSSAYVFLEKTGLSLQTTQRLSDEYGSPDILVSKIQTNPYILADEVKGIGWERADEIALNLGYKENSAVRIEAFIKYILKEEAEQNGNSWVYTEDLLDCIDNTLGEVGDDVISSVLQKLVKNQEIWSDKEREKIAFYRYFRLELSIAEELIRLNNADNQFNSSKWEEVIKNREQVQGWQYTIEQKQGIKTVLDKNVILITGFAGTGKTSIVSGMLDVLRNYSSAQCALTGKASVNLTEATGQEGKTIHRLLEVDKRNGGFKKNQKDKLEQDIIILDELSMVDEKLFYDLIKAIKTGAKLVMLGDIGQLESIGVGNVIRDLIESEVIAHVNLTEVHRQAKKSAITTESIKIWKGKQITDNNFVGVSTRGELRDLDLDITKESKTTADRIMKHFKEWYKKANYNLSDIQVIVPMRERGECCCVKLNNRIQSYVRKLKNRKEDEPFIENKHYKIYVGDKVINNKNNYDLKTTEGADASIMNGNFGIVKEVSEKELIVTFDLLGDIVIPSDHIEYIELGYCCTTHKMQGSGIKYVICGLDNSHYILRTKEMVYTMITRAKQHCVLCADNNSLRYAIAHSGSKDKLTFLKYFLQILNSGKTTEELIETL